MEENIQISRVTDGIYRGPRLEDLSPLIAMGIKSILNLEDDKKAVQAERLRAFSNGIQLYSFPMSGIHRPWSLELEMLAVNIDKIYEKPIYIHCLHGVDRTGMVVAAYRILIQGWTVEQASDEAIRMGHKWYFPPYWFWRKSLTGLRNK